MSWNVDDVCTKLEKSNVQQLLCQYDIIFINKVKTPLPVILSGCKSYKSNVAGSADRGSTVVFVKNWLSEAVFGVDTSIGDQVWMQLRNVPGVVFVFFATFHLLIHSIILRVPSHIQKKDCQNLCLMGTSFWVM